MQKLVIEGGKMLCGELKTQGAKNAVLPVMAAAVLCKGVSVLDNCPSITDSYCAVRIINCLGMKAIQSGGNCTIDAAVLDDNPTIPDRLMREMRSSIIFMGTLLGRIGRCNLYYPGGCDLGPHPIDMHISSLKRMGAQIEDEGEKITCCAPNGLHGCSIALSFPSVGATENIILAAVCAEGETVISNAAREPEICCMADFLRQCGAVIKGDGSGRIVIEGVEELKQPEGEVFGIYPDRIAAATYIACVASAGGEMLLTDCTPCHLEGVIPIFEQMGCYIKAFGSNIYIHKRDTLTAVDTIRTMVYPGFPTDVQAIVMAPLCTARGTTVFVENIFENRYRHTLGLCRMGADIKAEGKVAVVSGVKKLHGAKMDAPNLRGGAGLVTAALGAEGTSEIASTEYIDRGYENIEGNLTALGAKIRRISSG